MTFFSPAGLEKRDKSINPENPLGKLTDGTETIENLTQIIGIGADFERMLEAAGVHSIRDLALQDPTDLSDTLLELNLLRGLVKAVPSEMRVAGWVRQAQGFLLGH